MKQYSYIIPIHFRECVEGEYFKESSNTCGICPKGTYGLTKNSKECLRCPDNAECLGGSVLNIT